MKTDLETELETMIDKHSLSHVLGLLLDICAEKAAHIRATWQDETTARPWNAAANAITRIMKEIDV